MRSPLAIVASLTLIAITLCPSCIVVRAAVAVADAIYDRANSKPAKAVDAPEACDLAARVTGTLIVADDSSVVTCVALPSREVRSLHVGGSVIAASGPDDRGRIVYVRDVPSWTDLLFTWGNRAWVLYERDLISGRERRVAELADGTSYSRWTVHLARHGGVVACEREGDWKTMRLIDLANGHEVADARPLANALAYRFPDDPDPMLVEERDRAQVGRGLTAVGRGIDTRLDGPIVSAGDGLFVYEGLPPKGAGARRVTSWFGYFWREECALRLGDPRTGATLTLIPRALPSTFDFTPVELPSD